MAATTPRIHAPRPPRGEARPGPAPRPAGAGHRHLGFGGTYSTTYGAPFHVARVFATLDHLVGGRAAWNIVTSLNHSEAANFGQPTHPEQRPLRPRGRVPRGAARPLGLLGSRGHHHSTGRARDSPIPPRSTAPSLREPPSSTPRPLTGPAHAAGVSRCSSRPGSRTGPPLRSTLGRADLRHLAQSLEPGPAHSPRVQGRDRPDRAAIPIRCGSRPRPTGDRRRDAGHGRGQGRVHRPPGRFPSTALVLLSEVLNFDFAGLGNGRGVFGSEPRRHQRAAGPSRPRDPPPQRQAESDGPRLHPAQRPRDPARDAGIRRQCGRGRRRARGVVHRRGLRRICPSRRHMCRAPTKTSCGSWCRSCSGAGCFTASTQGRRCARASASRVPVAARGESRSGWPVEHTRVREQERVGVTATVRAPASPAQPMSGGGSEGPL